MNLCLANSDYTKHMTSEGQQLQDGLRSCGWSLAGYGYIDDCVDVRHLLDRYKPQNIFVQDCRDWRADSGGCFDKRVSFGNWRLLKECDARVFTVCKDAGTVIDYQQRFADEIGALAILIYYHQESVTKLSPWLNSYRLIRIYHSIDSGDILSIDLSKERRDAIVSGAVSAVYPTRETAIRNHEAIGLDVHRHPGYGNTGSSTPAYLRLLSGYKAHLACSSSYKFALRKIIESVAVGCIPVTDLPEYDILPAIDKYLVRIPQSASVDQIKSGVDAAKEIWSQSLALEMQEAAVSFYDYRDSGKRMSDAMKGA